jgi:hypothetical protein
MDTTPQEAKVLHGLKNLFQALHHDVAFGCFNLVDDQRHLWHRQFFVRIKPGLSR